MVVIGFVTHGHLRTGLAQIGCDNKQSSRRAKFRYNFHQISTYHRAKNMIFSFSGLFIFLTFNDPASEEAAFDVENAQFLRVYFFIRMQGHDVVTRANLIAHSMQDVIEQVTASMTSI